VPTMKKLFKALGLVESHDLESSKVLRFMEVWKEVKGFKSDYKVSNKGNIKSIDRWIEYSDGRKPRFFKGKVLSKNLGYGGYYTTYLRKNSSIKVFYIHRLVALSFCYGFEDELQVNHIDEDKLNNNSSNLEWVTKSQNSKHSNRGNSKRKFKDSQIVKIRNDFNNGESLYSISKRLNENSGTISNIVNRKTYKNIL